MRRIWLYRVLLLLTVSLVCGELGSRIYWSLKSGAPLLARRCLRYAQYPLLRSSDVENAARSRTGETFDILILGGSTISHYHGTIGRDLGDALQTRLRRPVRIFNLAYSGHNSRDSALKYRWVAEQRFDLVVVYDGINDARMNNSPPELFRDDYSHCHWYQLANRLDAHPVLFQAALPFTLLFLADRVLHETGLRWYIPRGVPRAGWADHGKDVRTRKTLIANLDEIVTSAKHQGARVVMMTFASYIPANYSLEAAIAGKIDYADPKNGGVELWGKPENIKNALKLQNEAVRELAREHPEAVFVDQDRLMPSSGKTFVDCCHFTPAGCEVFTRNLLAALEKVDLGGRPTPQLRSALRPPDLSTSRPLN